MRLLFFIALITTFGACKNSNDDKQMPSKANRETIGKDIVGIWELLKKSYRPTDEPSLVAANEKEYLEIKSDGTCQDGRNGAKWFLSFTDEYIIDSTSKIIFTELTNLTPNSWGDYDRTIKPHQLKLYQENNIKYLKLTSLKSSDTRIYIRKN